MKTSVLIIVDGLWHRSGVSSVIMNYHRNIDHENIQMDFLIFKDSASDVDLLNEVKIQGSIVYYMPSLGIRNVPSFINYINNFFAHHKQYKIIHSHLCIIDSMI